MKPSDVIGLVLAVGAVGAGAYAITHSKGGGGLSGSRRRRGGLRGESEAHELLLFCENDGDIYRQQGQPILKNLITKMARGVYDHNKAVKLYGYLAETCAKKYNKEFGDESSLPWHKMFSAADRREVAEHFVKTFETEAKLGNYDHLLPKKYQKRTLHGWG